VGLVPAADGAVHNSIPATAAILAPITVLLALRVPRIPWRLDSCGGRRRPVPFCCASS